MAQGCLAKPYTYWKNTVQWTILGHGFVMSWPWSGHWSSPALAYNIQSRRRRELAWFCNSCQHHCRFDDSWASCAVDCVGIRFRVAGCNGCLWVWLQAWYAGMFSDVFTVLLQNIHLAVELDKCVKCWTLGWKLVVSCYRSALHAELITPSITCHTVVGKQDAATSCSFQRILLTWCNMDSGTLTPCHIGIITKWSWCHCLVADTIIIFHRNVCTVDFSRN